MREQPYMVELDTSRTSTIYMIQGPDGASLEPRFRVKTDADELAQLLNDAYEEGERSGCFALEPFQQIALELYHALLEQRNPAYGNPAYPAETTASDERADVALANARGLMVPSDGGK